MVTLRSRRPLGLLGQLILGMVSFGLGGAFLYFVAADFTLVCDRADNTCLLGRNPVFSDPEIVASLAFADLQGAEIQESRNSKGKSLYQVMLVTGNTRIPFADGLHVGYGTCAKIAGEINRFVRSGDGRLSVRQSGTILKFFGWTFAAAGAILILRAGLAFLRRLLGLFLA